MKRNLPNFRVIMSVQTRRHFSRLQIENEDAASDGRGGQVGKIVGNAGLDQPGIGIVKGVSEAVEQFGG